RAQPPLPPWQRWFARRRGGGQGFLSSVSVVQLEYRYAGDRAAWLTWCFSPETLLSTRIYGMLHLAGGWPPAWWMPTWLQPLRQLARMCCDRLAAQERSVAEPHQGLRAYLEAAWQGSGRALPGEISLRL